MILLARRHEVPQELTRAGFSLLEVLIALSITLVVMALVAQTMSHVRRVFEAQTGLATASSATTLAFDDMAHELSRSGYGLGNGVDSVLPRVPGKPAGASSVTLRSNPEVLAGHLRAALDGPGEDVAVTSADEFGEGAIVLLADARGRDEVAEIVRVSSGAVALRSRETADGEFRYPFGPATGGRVLALREVRYYVREVSGDGVSELVKEVVGVGTRVLARDVLSLGFEYIDERGDPIASAKVEDGSELASVRIRLRYRPSDNPLEPQVLATTVAMNRASGSVDFESRETGFRLSRYFHPIDHPAGVASRVGADWAVLLAGGAEPHRNPALAYTFSMERRFNDARVDDVTWLEEVRAPVTLTFGPERGPLAGSLFVAAWGLRIGHLSRVAPDANGGISSESEVTVFEGTEAIAQAGGMAFGVDGGLYVTSREKGGIYRYQFDTEGQPVGPERLFSLRGAPGEMVEGADGFLYFLLDEAGTGSLWRMAFDEALTLVEPVRVGVLPGLGLSLARDPIEGDLFVLVRSSTDDYVVVELSRTWMNATEESDETPSEPPRVVFSLEEWQRSLEEGDVRTTEIPFHPSELPSRMSALRTDELDFLAFDAFGSLYVGAQEADLVLEFELPRPSGRYTVGLAAGVVERRPDSKPEVRMHAWKKLAF